MIVLDASAAVQACLAADGFALFGVGLFPLTPLVSRGSARAVLTRDVVVVDA